MAKYENFNLGALKQYDKLWSPNDAKFLQTYIDNSAMLKVKYGFWRKNFEIDREIRTVDSNGVAAFNIQSKKYVADGMAEYKAPLAHSTPFDRYGVAGYSGSFANFGKSAQDITVEDRMRMEKEFEMYRKEDPFLDEYVEDIQRLRNYCDSLLSHNAGELISTGMILGRDDTGLPIMTYQDAKVPTENKVKAGTKVWSDPTADILDYMHKIETNYRLRTGDEQPMKWQITLNQWRNNFLTNTVIKEKITDWRKVRELPVSSGGTVLEEWYMEYVNSLGLTSPIEIVTEGEIRDGVDTRTAVQGWSDNVAVLRPRGFAGVIVHADIARAIMSEKYKSNSVKRNVAYIENNLYAIINSVIDVDGWTRLRTEIEGCAAPALTCAPYLIIVDTATAD